MRIEEWLYFPAKPINPEVFQDLEPPKEEQGSLPFAIEIFKQMMNDPNELCCPISLSLFQDPVIDGVGHTYDRQFIQTHFKVQKEKNQPLTSPLSHEPLEDDRLIPNREKKSKIEQYKVDKAQRCFELAKQSIDTKCGDTALMLLKRASYLNSALEGLNEIEAVARKTFISVRRQRIAYTFQAEALIENKKSSEALDLVKPLIEKPVYTYSVSDPSLLSLFRSKFQALVGKYLIIRPLNTEPLKGEFIVWDTEKNAIFDIFYQSQIVKTIQIKDVLLLCSTNNRPDFLYNSTTKRVDPLVYENPNVTFKHKLDERRFTLSDQKQLQKREEQLRYSLNKTKGHDYHNHYNYSRIGSSNIRKEEGITAITAKTGELLGCVYSNRCSWVFRVEHGASCNGAIDSHAMIGIAVQYTEDHPEEYLTTYVFLISDRGIKQLSADRQGWQLDQQGNFRVTNQEEFINAYFPQEQASTHYLNPFKTNNFQVELPDGKMIRGIYRNRLIAGVLRPESKSFQNGDEEFSTYTISSAVLSNREDSEFYKTVLKASVLEGDFESYLKSMEHLVGSYHLSNTWDELEKFMSSLAISKDVILEHLRAAIEESKRQIEESKRQDDEIWIGRLYLYVGLFQDSFYLKQQAYHQAHKIHPEDLDIESAIAYTASIQQVSQMPYQELLRMTEEQRQTIEKTQQEMSKLQQQVLALSDQIANLKESSKKVIEE